MAILVCCIFGTNVLSPQKRTITNNFLTQHPSFFQASWVCRCDTSFVLNLENEFKSILGAPADLETWAEWLQSVVNIALASVSGTTTFTKAARQFLLKWSFYRLVPLQSFLLYHISLKNTFSFMIREQPCYLGFGLTRAQVVFWDSVSGPPYLNSRQQSAGLEPMTIEGKNLYGQSSSSLHYTMRRNLLNWCNLVSIIKKLRFYVFGLVRIIQLIYYKKKIMIKNSKLKFSEYIYAKYQQF